jgi:hypothetical protein
MSDNLVNIRPKTLNKTYKRTKYTITYDVADKSWRWEVEYVSVTRYGETAKSINAAQKAAEKHIDKTLEIKGG